MLWPFTPVIGPTCVCPLQATTDPLRAVPLDTFPFRRYITQQITNCMIYIFYNHSDIVAFTLWFVQIEDLTRDTPVRLRAVGLRGDHMGMESCPLMQPLRSTEEQRRRPEKNVGRVTKTFHH